MARVWVFDDDISTDGIIAGRYLASFEIKHDPRELAKHAMESVDPTFAAKVRKGDVIIAGKNFGCGSSREEAPIALKAAGISAIVAESFARIFYRNSVNQGLPALTCPGVRRGFKSGDKAEVDLKRGIVQNTTTGKTFKVDPLPDFILAILRAGGLIPYLKRVGKSGKTILR